MNKSLFAILALALILVGFYTVDFEGSSQASIISLPDFDTEVQAAQDTPVNSLKDLNDAIVNIAEKTKPAVVTIFTTQTIETPENPLFRFFGEDPRGGGGEREVSGLGSGVIVSEDGYILTNNHVVEAAESINVETVNGDVLEAEVVGTDPQTDIAVLKINAENLPTIELGNSDDLRVGEFVMAIGSPFGEELAHSVSFGIVSGKGRTNEMMARRTGGYQNFIQTDAAINPGNSGGALINLDGELVGINTAILSRSGGNQGIGFAIPANLAKNIMNQLIETGEVQRGYLGITGDGVDRTMARALGLDKPQGVIVGGVQENTPAAESGLKEGDVIRTLDGKTVEGWLSFRTAIASKRPGDTVELGVLRDGDEQTVTVTLGEFPEELQASAGQQQRGAPDQNLEESIGFNVRNITPAIAEELQLDPNINGVVVTGINRNSNAARQGLRQGDVITSIAKEQVQNVEDFNRIMSELTQQENQVVLMRIIRQGNGLFIAFEI
ncbi:Do family serine endopeptidase [Aliifodinibius sp. S!AR15-10]|nr:Do family serine endopeptidase [Aliifodinibius sp. S!AR15-10]